MVLKAAMLSGGYLGSELPGTLSFHNAELHCPGRIEFLVVRKQQVSEGPVDENSGILMSRSAAKV